MFLLPLLANKDSYNTQIIQCVIRHSEKGTGYPLLETVLEFRTGSFEPVPTLNH